MSLWPLIVFHICSGTVALLSGAVAMFLRKGSRQAWPGWRRVCHFYAGLVGERGHGGVDQIPFNEFPSSTGFLFCRHSNPLPGRNRVVVRQAQRWRNGHF